MSKLGAGGMTSEIEVAGMTSEIEGGWDDE
jgi:hypothetical protein